MNVDVCDNWRSIEASKMKDNTEHAERKMDKEEKDLPVRLPERETSSNAGTNERYGELDESPLMESGRVSPVWINSVRKLCAVVSLALSGS
jgi:hypothetical protein